MPAAIVSRGRGSRPAPPCARRYGGAPLRQTACRGGDHGRITHNPPSPPRRPCFLSANNPAVLKVFFFFRTFQLPASEGQNMPTLRLDTIPKKKENVHSEGRRREGRARELLKAGHGCRGTLSAAARHRCCCCCFHQASPCKEWKTEGWRGAGHCEQGTGWL